MTNEVSWKAGLHGRIRGFLSSNARVTLALIGVMAACLVMDQPQAIIPSLLGVIASALAETDDNWRGRLGAQLTTILFFADHRLGTAQSSAPRLSDAGTGRRRFPAHLVRHRWRTLSHDGLGHGDHVALCRHGDPAACGRCALVQPGGALAVWRRLARADFRRLGRRFPDAAG